jgi:hypothetical protein
MPFFGKAQSIVAVVRQPVDIDGAQASQERFLTRLATAANGRFPPWRGLAIGLTALVLTSEPIAPTDDEMLGEVLMIRLKRMRALPLRLFRANLAQEAVALAIKSSPDGLFTEPRTWPIRFATSSTAMFHRSRASRPARTSRIRSEVIFRWSEVRASPSMNRRRMPKTRGLR